MASPDSLDAVSLFVINDEGTSFVRRPRNLDPAARAEVASAGREGRVVDGCDLMRVKLAGSRASLPVVPGLNFNINRWSAGAPGSTYFVPVTDITPLYINALLEAFEPEMGLFVIDERNYFRPAGLRRFSRRRGGHLRDDPADGRVVPVQGLEMSFVEAAGVEMGGVLHALGLMSQTLGIGGFCSYARTEFEWLRALGFDMQPMDSGRYVGAGRVMRFLARVSGRSVPFSFATALRRNGELLLEAFCPPNYPDMEAAVHGYVEWKFGDAGGWTEDAPSAWRSPEEVRAALRRPSTVAIDATVAYCRYLFDRYGRFPAWSAPFRTAIGYQATHVDLDFYDAFYEAGAVTNTQRARAGFT